MDATLEAAARGDIPEQFAHTLGIALSADGRHAVVLLGTNERSDPYPYPVVCEREEERWIPSISGNAPGWSTTGDLGVLTAWGEAPAGTTVTVIEFAGREHEVAVRSGYYPFAAWDVPYDATAVVRGTRFRG